MLHLFLNLFLVDLFTPSGLAIEILYPAALLIAVWLPGRRTILAMAALCTLLAAVGYFASTAGETPPAAFTNRLLAFVAIWSVTF